jgi:hypothetical protein
MRKQSNYKPKGVNPWAYQNVTRLNSPFTTDEAMQISYQGWDSFDRLLTGIGDKEDLQAMESMASVMRIVSKSLSEVVSVADKAIAAAIRGKAREKAGLDGEGIQACRTALHYFDDLLVIVKRGEFMEALADVAEKRNASNEMAA